VVVITWSTGVYDLLSLRRSRRLKSNLAELFAVFLVL
jgi:hypothetical protein